MIAAVGLVVLVAALPRRIDADIPPAPPPFGDSLEFRDRELGTGTTLFVNFDGIDLGECSPSNSKKNCTWYNFDDDFPPFSGSLQTQVSVIQAIRRDVADFGVRVTSLRPPSDENYVMVVYGGTEEKYGALGSAPSGDCLDQSPNEIAFAHLDGEPADAWVNDWVNGGATTALHEAAHTWGLDHVDLENEVMYPSSDNRPTAFANGCTQIVENTDLDPGGVGCPEVNAMLCDADDQQSALPLLAMMFGPPYVDTIAPVLALDGIEDGEYFQAPASFDVALAVDDDLHPQAYEMWAWMGDDSRPPQASQVLAPGFSVEDLPVGTWTFHVIVADLAGHESPQLDFTIEVGLDPPPEEPQEDGAGCRLAPAPAGTLALCVGPLLLARRRRRR
jgi:hypothetical protein